MANTGKKPGPALWLSLVITTIGAALLSFGLYTGFSHAFDLLSVEAFPTPGAQTRNLSSGEYEVYEKVGERGVFDFDDDSLFRRSTAGLDNVRVTNAETGEQLSLRITNAPNLDRNSTVYAPIGRFVVDQDGEYQISVQTSEPTTALVGRSLEPALRDAVPRFVMGGIGALIFLLGLGLLIAGVVRRSRAKKSLSPVGAGAYAAPDFQSPYRPAPPPPAAGTTPPPAPAPGTQSAPPGASGPAPTAPIEPSVDPNIPDTSTPWD